jgi:hypothetical protein
MIKIIKKQQIFAATYFLLSQKKPLEGLHGFAICTTKGGSWLRLGIYLIY